MSEDAWRRGRRKRNEGEDFGPPLFGEVPTTEVRPGDLSFGESDTGALPHWTEPPTGEVPRVVSDNGGNAGGERAEEVDVWSSFSGQSPVWRDEPPGQGGVDDLADLAPVVPDDSASERAYYGAAADDTGRDESAPVRREPGRITIGTDPSDSAGRPMPARRGRPGEPPSRSGRPRSPAPRPGATSGGSTGRDMPTAIAVGVALAVVFVVALRWRPAAVLVIIVAVLGLAAVEFFEKVTEKGYRPVTVVGMVACVAAPIATYWIGEQALPLVLVLAFAAGCVTFFGATSLESGPMPNMAITTLGVVWIGMLGSFGALILRFSTVPFFVAAGHLSKDVGTDTLLLLAIGVAVNDIGALFVGSAAGRKPLRAWISPSKTIEGFVGGTVATLLVLGVIGSAGKSDTWNSLGDCLLLGIVICITAPLGDLAESMFKRNLDVKDFGTLVRGHGGVLDRFDGFLFTLPAAFYLLEVLKPWVTK